MVEKIRIGEIDINNQELFFSILIKGLLLELKKGLSIRQIPIPHYILHTGSDALYLEQKGQDFSLEPNQVSNEDYIYSIIPRCIVNPRGIDLSADQLTNPYSIGQLQYDSGDNLYNLCGEFRRLPLKMDIELKYYVDSYRDLLELVQQTLTKLAFIRTFYITYMGQQIICSYKIPDSYEGEFVTELDGQTQDNKCRLLNLTIEIETNLPIYEPRTIMSCDNFIMNGKSILNGQQIKDQTREIN